VQTKCIIVAIDRRKAIAQARGGIKKFGLVRRLDASQLG
jgi:hypothetical protein